MDAIVTITGTCAGGNHVFVDVTRGKHTKTVVLLKDDLLSAEHDWVDVDTEEKAVCKELQRAAKQAGAQNFDDLKILSTDLPLSL